MATRRRLGVALLVDAPQRDAIDGLRRAVGDPDLARIAPHVTLVPPVNVRVEALADALAVLRAAAAASAELTLTLGPPSSFLPANPVLHLPVGGDLSGLRALRDAVFAPPLARPLSWPWVPHVTLRDDLEAGRIAAAVEVLAGYQTVLRATRVVLLEERRRPAGPGDPGGRSWVPLADAALGPAAVVGRGGRELTLVTGREVGPDAVDLVAAAGLEVPPTDRSAVVVSGLVAGRLVGVGRAWRDDGGSHAAVLVAGDRRREGLGRLVLAGLEEAVRRAGWAPPYLQGVGPAGFYLACSAWTRPG